VKLGKLRFVGRRRNGEIDKFALTPPRAATDQWLWTLDAPPTPAPFAP
jgi:hypothetical protein